jgi:hypothetical protein
MITEKYGNTTLLHRDSIPENFSHEELNEFIVMPNHIHMITKINNKVHGTVQPSFPVNKK